MNVRSLIGLSISAALVYVFFRSVDLTSIGGAILSANAPLLGLAIAIYFVGLWLRAARWRRLVAPFATVPTARLLRIIVVGFAINNLLPLRLGELVRTVLLRRSHGVSVATGIGSILIERLLDVTALCGIMAAVSLLAPLDGWLAALAALCWIVLGGAVVGASVLLVTPRAWLRRLLDLLAVTAGHLSPRLESLVRSFVGGVRALETPGAVLTIGVLSMACWVSELGLYYFVMLALGFDSGVGSLAVGMVAANLATVLPSSPGYVGTFDVPLQAALNDGFGVTTATAASYTLLTHAVLLVPVVLVGLVLLAREDLSPRALGRGKVETRSERRLRTTFGSLSE